MGVKSRDFSTVKSFQNFVDKVPSELLNLKNYNENQKRMNIVPNEV